MKDNDPTVAGQYDKDTPLLPSQKYGELVKKIPGLQYTLSALDQVSRMHSLKDEDNAALVEYSMWMEYPDAIKNIAEAFNITPDQLQADINHVMENLENIWEQVDTLQEDLREANEPLEVEESPVSIPIFEKPVKASSGRTRSYNLGLIDREDILFERIKEILDEREWTVAIDYLNGKDDEEIGRELGLSPASIPRIRSQARKKIEPVLASAGLHRLRKISRSQEVVVGRGDQAEGVNMLGMWYGREEGITVFEQRSRKVDEEMLRLGYEPITRFVPWQPKTDYGWIVSTAKRRGLSVKHKNRWYIKEEDILSLMQERGLDITPQS